MGSHRKNIPSHLALPIKRPKVPNNIGKMRKIQGIHGEWIKYIIEDEIIRFQTTFKHKLISFQRIRFFMDNRIEYRLGYYMIGVKPRMRGKWVWGQFCLLIPEIDLVEIIKEAKKRKWF